MPVENEQTEQRTSESLDEALGEQLGDVALGVTVELGRAELTIRRLLSLKEGSVIELSDCEEGVFRVRVNGKHVASGDPVIVNDRYGLRINQIIDPEGLP